jgi:hypothetical protein
VVFQIEQQQDKKDHHGDHKNPEPLSTVDAPA